MRGAQDLAGSRGQGLWGAASWCRRGLASLLQHLALTCALNLEPSLLPSQTRGPKKH